MNDLHRVINHHRCAGFISQLIVKTEASQHSVNFTTSTCQRTPVYIHLIPPLRHGLTNVLIIGIWLMKIGVRE